MDLAAAAYCVFSLGNDGLCGSCVGLDSRIGFCGPGNSVADFLTRTLFMPGICGIVSATQLAEPLSQLAAMLKPLCRHAWHREDCFTDDVGIILGSVVLSNVHSERQPVQSRDGHLHLVLDGELYDV